MKFRAALPHVKHAKFFQFQTGLIDAMVAAGISDIVVSVPNVDLPNLAQNQNHANALADQLAAKLRPGVQVTVAFGNEPTAPWYNGEFLNRIVPALTNMRNALQARGLSSIKLTVPFDASILGNTYPPSAGTLSAQSRAVVSQVARLLRDNGSPFFINLYTFFAYIGGSVPLPYALLQTSHTASDGVTYPNMLAAMVAALRSALLKEDRALTEAALPITVGETGWPTCGNAEATVANAMIYVQQARKSGLNLYFFEAFDEKRKSGGAWEPCFGYLAENGVPKGGAAVCPQIPGYTLQLDVDHYGDDISQIPGDITAVAAACSADARCQSFNVDGYIKTVGGNTQSHADYCFWVKRCPEIPGYALQRDVDHYGDDISQIPGDITAVAAACSADARCQSFNVEGYIKTVGGNTQFHVDYCFWVKKCPEIPGYALQRDVDHYGDDISQIPGDITAVAAACSADARCQSFNVDGYIKTVGGNTQSHADYCFWVKRCPEIPGYALQRDVDHYGDDISQIPGDITAVAAACSADARCQSFNVEGYIKTVGGNTQSHADYCFWVKEGGTLVGPTLSGRTTRYWDCCKPSCAWNGKADVTRPVATCAADGVTVQSDPNLPSGCGGGPAYSCTNNMPWAVNENFALGFAAANLGGLAEAGACCACYELTFTTTGIAGKKMVVQVTNSGGDLTTNHFDLQMPGGGVGLFNGCQAQWKSPADGWGSRFGGVSTRQECLQLPAQLQPGCFWRFDWFGNANNPDIRLRRVRCPTELTSRTMCVRNDDAKYASYAMPAASSIARRDEVLSGQRGSRGVAPLIWAGSLIVATALLVGMAALHKWQRNSLMEEELLEVECTVPGSPIASLGLAGAESSIPCPGCSADMEHPEGLIEGDHRSPSFS